MRISILSVLFALVYSPAVMAASSAFVELSSSAATQSVQLKDEKYEPIYESQPYEDTCSREVFDHTETTCSTSTSCSGGGTVCTDSPDQVCNSQGCTTITRRSCHTESESCSDSTSCSDRAIYRTEYYSCTKYRDVVVGHRLVKTFYHQVEVVIEQPAILQNQKMKIEVIAQHGSVNLKLLSAFSSHLLIVESEKLSDVNTSTEQKLSQKILIKTGFSTEVLNQLLSSKIENLELHYSGIQFDLKGLAELSKDLNIELFLVQQRKLIKDLVIFDGTIASSALSPVVSGKDLKVIVPLEKMELSYLKSKRHNIEVAVSFKKPNLKILNDTDLSAILKHQVKGDVESVYPQ
jgi:hypothetical protein